MKGRLAIPNRVGTALAGLVLFSLLVVIGRTHTHHLFIRSTFELLSVIAALAIFLTMWHFRHLLFDPFFLIISTGCLFIGALGLVQAVISREANIVTGIASGDLHVQFSIVTGILESGTLFGALLSFKRPIKPITLFAGYSLVCGLALASIFLWHTFPDCYRPATGLTSFGRGSISFTILFLMAAAGLLFQRRKPLLPALFPILLAAIIFAILAELSFDLFTGIPNNLFHAFEFSSLFCIYLAVVKAGRQSATSGSLNFDEGITENDKAVEDVVRASRDWERTFDAVPDLITILDSDHRIKRVNRAMADTFGKHPREMIGRRCFEFVHRTSQPIEGCPLNQVLVDGQPHTTEIYEPSLDGHFLVHVVPLRNEKGEVDGAVHVARDITETKRAEKLRKESEERYRILFEQTAELLFLYHLDENGQPGPLSEVNEATCRILGYTREEMQRQSLSDFCEKSADGKPCPMPSFGQGGLVTLMLIAKNGMRVLVEASSHLFEFKGRPTVLSVGRDITERKVMELELQRYQGRLENLVREKTAELIEMNKTLRTEVLERTEVEKILRENEHYLRQILEEFNGLLQAIPDTLILLSQDLKILWTNKASDGGVRPGQRSPEGLICHQLWAGRTTPCLDCPTLRSFSSGKPEHGQVHSADGRTWEVRAFPIKDEAGRVSKVIETATDVTENITLQAEAIRAAHLASLGELAAGVAHEINNPINGIINYAQMIANKIDNESREHDIARRIIKEGDRIAIIVRSLLSFARAKKEEKRPVHVREILLDSLTLTEAQLRRDFIHLETRLPKQPLVITANGSQIEQVFLNLINNARYALNQKYPEAHDDKRLEISGEIVTSEGRKYVRLIFHDHGTGIAAAIRDNVMAPFFSDKPGGKGTGLGLSISHGIITDHEGKISIDTVEGEYTNFIIDLPARGEG